MFCKIKLLLLLSLLCSDIEIEKNMSFLLLFHSWSRLIMWISCIMKAEFVGMIKISAFNLLI